MPFLKKYNDKLLIKFLGYVINNCKLSVVVHQLFHGCVTRIKGVKNNLLVHLF